MGPRRNSAELQLVVRFPVSRDFATLTPNNPAFRLQPQGLHGAGGQESARFVFTGSPGRDGRHQAVHGLDL